MINSFRSSCCVLFGSILIASSLLTSCQNEISEIRAITDVNRQPVQTSYNAEYTFTEKGKASNRLIAAQIDQYQGELDYIEASGGFTMIFFDSLEKEEAKLTARTGRYTESQKKNYLLKTVLCSPT
jgi:lipopolysaccharide export system protein LptC